MTEIGRVFAGGPGSGYTHAHRLTGPAVVDSTGTPRRARVVILDERTAAYWASTWTDADGYWEIRGLPALAAGQELAVIAYDLADERASAFVHNVVQGDEGIALVLRGGVIAAPVTPLPLQVLGPRTLAGDCPYLLRVGSQGNAAVLAAKERPDAPALRGTVRPPLPAIRAALRAKERRDLGRLSATITQRGIATLNAKERPDAPRLRGSVAERFPNSLVGRERPDAARLRATSLPALSATLTAKERPDTARLVADSLNAPDRQSSERGAGRDSTSAPVIDPPLVLERGAGAGRIAIGAFLDSQERGAGQGVLAAAAEIARDALERGQGQGAAQSEQRADFAERGAGLGVTDYGAFLEPREAGAGRGLALALADGPGEGREAGAGRSFALTALEAQIIVEAGSGLGVADTDIENALAPLERGAGLALLEALADQVVSLRETGAGRGFPAIAAELVLEALDGGAGRALAALSDPPPPLAVAVNTRSLGISQYEGFPFDSLATLLGQEIAAGPDGLYRLEDGPAVPATLRTGMLTLPQLYRLRGLYAQGVFGGPLRVRLTHVEAGQRIERWYRLTPTGDGKTARCTPAEGPVSDQWRVQIDSPGGAFRLEALKLHAVPLTRRV